MVNAYPIPFVLAAFAASALLYRQAVSIMPALCSSHCSCGVLGLGIRSVLRLRGLNLPARAGRLVLLGNWAAVVGIVLCALIFVERALR